MMKYEAPVAELEIFTVGNVMTQYGEEEEEPEITENMTPIL